MHKGLADLQEVHDGRVCAGRAWSDACLHQSEQRLCHHRRAALRARNFGEFLSESNDWAGDDDGPARVREGGQHSRQVLRTRSQSRGDHGEEQAGQNPCLYKLQNGVTFSAERADKCTKKEDGIDDCLAYVGKTLPNEYSADLSLFVLEAGVRIPGRESRI